MTVTPAELPRSLVSEGERTRRRAMLVAPDMAPLAMFVQGVRTRMGSAYQIPDFDPLGGGVTAECLMLLEAPGPRAVRSGFISQDNPDNMAATMFDLFHEVGLDRRRMALWNIVPWYVGDGTRIAPVRRADIERAVPFLRELAEYLRSVTAVVLVGRKAQRATRLITTLWPRATLFDTPHPSPVNLNCRPNARAEILNRLGQVATALMAIHRGV